MSGALNMNANINMNYPASAQFSDFLGSNNITISSPNSISSSYGIKLPANAPSGAQVLQAQPGSSPFSTNWVTVGGGSPTKTLTIYVSLGGDDDTGDGSVTSPYRTVKHAVDVANTISTIPTPVTIMVNSGYFEEDPIILSADYIAIVG